MGQEEGLSEADQHTDDVTTWAEYMRIHVLVLRLGNAIDVPALRRLYEACKRAGLSTALADDVMRSVDGYDHRQLAESIAMVRRSELRFTLLADYCQLARAARIEDASTEPLLVQLASALGVTAEQHDAIARFIAACERDPDNPWRDEITEIRFALNRIAQTGASAAAVSATRSPLTLRSGSAAATFAGLTRLCGDVLHDDPSVP